MQGAESVHLRQKQAFGVAVPKLGAAAGWAGAWAGWSSSIHLTRCRYKLTAPFLWGQEGIYKYSAADGSTFQFTLFLLVVECALNVAVAVVGASAAGLTPGLPQEMFALTGATQIAAKFFTNAAMASGVSFPTQVPRRPPPARGRHSCGLS